MKARNNAVLPLPSSQSRCLGHSQIKGVWCEKYNECARHATISHDDEPWAEVSPPSFRLCQTDEFLEFVGIEHAGT